MTSPSDELPGMWEWSDLYGGETDTDLTDEEARALASKILDPPLRGHRMNLLPDVEYQPELAICPLCRQRVMVTHHKGDSGWVGIATHLSNGEWCGQHEVFSSPTLKEGK